jgi:HAD superfamily, subfamily IIIB (Acid phosphatase)
MTPAASDAAFTRAFVVQAPSAGQRRQPIIGRIAQIAQKRLSGQRQKSIRELLKGYRSGGCFAAFAALAVMILLAPGSALAEPPAGCAARHDPPVRDLQQTANLDFFKHELLYYRCTRYDIDVALVLQEAQQWVAKRAPQLSRPAIVLDIDETSLSNWKRIYTDDFAYIQNGPCDFARPHEACGDIMWQRSEQAPAIEPTRDLYNFARCYKQAPPCATVDVFFVTGRHESNDRIDGKTPTEWTLDNLRKAGYEGLTPDHLYMRPATSSGLVSDYKSAARADIEKRGFAIIANVGDQDSDLAGGHAERTFKVPNPFYFIP